MAAIKSARAGACACGARPRSSSGWSARVSASLCGPIAASSPAGAAACPRAPGGVASRAFARLTWSPSSASPCVAGADMVLMRTTTRSRRMHAFSRTCASSHKKSDERAHYRARVPAWPPCVRRSRSHTRTQRQRCSYVSLLSRARGVLTAHHALSFSSSHRTAPAPNSADLSVSLARAQRAELSRPCFQTSRPCFQMSRPLFRTPP